MWTGCRAFLAHWTGTLRFFERREQVRAFYSPAMGEPARRALIERYGITWVIVGADGPALEGIPWLIPMFQRPHAAVFRVQPARGGSSAEGAR